MGAMSEPEGDVELPTEPSPLVASLSGFQTSLQQILGRYYQDLEVDLVTWSDLNKVESHICISSSCINHLCFDRRRRKRVPRSRLCVRRSRRDSTARSA